MIPIHMRAYNKNRYTSNSRHEDQLGLSTVVLWASRCSSAQPSPSALHWPTMISCEHYPMSNAIKPLAMICYTILYTAICPVTLQTSSHTEFFSITSFTQPSAHFSL